MTHGLILFAHGARDPAWAAPFQAIDALVRARRPALQVRLAFLELMKPSLPEAAAALVEAGCRRVDIRPMFLGTGSHVRRDLPLILDDLRRRHADVEFRLHEAIGEHPGVQAAMSEAIVHAVSTAAGPPAGGSP